MQPGVVRGPSPRAYSPSAKRRLAGALVARTTDRRAPRLRGGEAEDYDDRTIDELRVRAAEFDIEGRSSMSNDELINALRQH